MTPLNNHLLVRKRKVEEKTAGGIIMTESMLNKKNMEELEVEVVSIGEAAFLGLYIKPVIGDTVLISRYAGSDQRTEEGEYEQRLINDDDVVAIMRDIDIEKTIKEHRK